MRVDPGAFRQLDLRCHALLSDVPLHDVWAIPLRGGGPGRTMRDVDAVSPLRHGSFHNVLVQGLFTVRRALGELFGWDEPRHDTPAGSYLHRLTDDDRRGSLVPPGTRQGPFRLLYLFPDEAVGEIRNATVHAFLVTALRAENDGYVLYWAIYVKPVGTLTGLYMTLIDPFRRLIVYPALIREMQSAWSQAYAQVS